METYCLKTNINLVSSCNLFQIYPISDFKIKYLILYYSLRNKLNNRYIYFGSAETVCETVNFKKYICENNTLVKKFILKNQIF